MAFYYRHIPSLKHDLTLAMQLGRKVVSDLTMDEFFIFNSDDGYALFIFDEGFMDQSQALDKAISTQFDEPDESLLGTAAIREFFIRSIGIKSLNAGNSVYRFRKSFALARKQALAGPVFRYLYHQSIWLSEKIRGETDFYSLACNYERVLDEVARKIFGKDTRPTLSMIGDAAPFRDILDAFSEGHPDAPPDKGLALQGNGVLQPSLITLLGPDYENFVSAEKLNRAYQKSSGQSFLVISKNAGPKLPANVFLYSIDDLKKIASETLVIRNKEVKKIEPLIKKSVAAFEEWLKSDSRSTFLNIISKSQKMQQIFETISKIAQTNITVLISGESGTGKELIAQALHRLSGRDPEKLIVVNAGAIPENLLESELFGHVKGAFTGAVSSKRGLFMDADGGTIFLDEIGELPQTLQVKLLRFLQNGEIRPVGSNQSIVVNVRVVAATNRDLADMVKKGLFRSDLYYRLNVIPIHLPALRERKEDIVLLVRHFIKKYSGRMGRDVGRISDKALARLLQYDWPGNIRELENIIEHTVALASGNVIHDFDLPDVVSPYITSKSRSLKDMEEAHILSILDECDGNYDKACAILGISRTTLWRKLKQYGLQPPPAVSD